MFGHVPSVLTSVNVTAAVPQLSVAVSVAAGTVAISSTQRSGQPGELQRIRGSVLSTTLIV